ncbi:MAG TPA: hypothetical protein PKU94_09015 [Candidatus Hydrothermia bacterium]|nr:hypothetical protein [Candidatus Hydrothermia bacterium]
MKRELRLREDITELKNIVEEIYEQLGSMRCILKKYPEVYEKALRSWIANIDTLLENRDGWMDRSTRAQDTIETLEQMLENGDLDDDEYNDEDGDNDDEDDEVIDVEPDDEDNYVDFG